MARGVKASFVGLERDGLKVIEEFRIEGTKYRVKILCHCGNVYERKKESFTSGRTKNCGCIKRPNYKGKHGKYKNRIYKIFFGIKDRCCNEKSYCYENYGGRGIKMCDEWLEVDGFLKFEKWAYENGYKDNLSIDRIDVNGNYEPSNCRWATDKEQGRNKRNTWYEMLNGERVMVTEICEKYGLNMNTLGVRKSRGKSNDELFIGLKCAYYKKN